MSAERLNDEPAHSPYGPSGAEGWSTCLDYINANRGLPDNAGELAAEGTFAHQISDECVTFGLTAYDFIGQRLKVNGYSFTWDFEDADLLQPGIEKVRAALAEFPDAVFYGERRVRTEKWSVEGQFGTLDRAIATPDLISIIDLKWGRGVPVYPVRNKQLVLYSLGFWEEVKHLYTDAPEFELRIDQPRCPGGGGVWRTSLAELEEIGAWLRERAQISASSDVHPRTASELGCMWCRRKDAPGGCDTYETWRLELIGLEFADLDAEEFALPEMTPERRAKLLLSKGGIERWLEAHYAQATQDALASRPIGEIKLVQDSRKGTRDKWLDEAAATVAAEAILGEKCFNKKLKTPLQLDKQIGVDRIDADDQRKVMEPLIERGQKGFSLVPMADARPPFIPISGDDFDDL